MDPFFKSEVVLHEVRDGDNSGIPQDYTGRAYVYPWLVAGVSGINGTHVVLPGVKSVSRSGDDITVVLNALNADVKWDPKPPPPPPVTVGPVDIAKQLRDLINAIGSIKF